MVRRQFRRWAEKSKGGGKSSGVLIWRDKKRQPLKGREGFAKIAKKSKVRPWGESSPYDVGLEYAGRFMRVQVKSTTLKVCHSYVCNTRPCNRAQVYAVRQIDFLAAYVIPVDAWYILPVRVAVALKGNILLSPHKKGHKYESFVEAWALLKAWHRR